MPEQRIPVGTVIDYNETDETVDVRLSERVEAGDHLMVDSQGREVDVPDVGIRRDGAPLGHAEDGATVQVRVPRRVAEGSSVFRVSTTDEGSDQG